MKRIWASAAWTCLLVILVFSFAAWQQSKVGSSGDHPSAAGAGRHLIESSAARAASMPGRIDIDSTALLMTMLSGPSDPSMEMRENIDFLATPAMAVMQACSTDTVINYPSE